MRKAWRRDGLPSLSFEPSFPRRIAPLQERDVFPFVEEVRRIALNKKLARVYYEYGFDVLSAVPLELFKSEDFLSKRWPQIQALVAEQRASQTKLCSKYPSWPGSIHNIT